MAAAGPAEGAAAAAAPAADGVETDWVELSMQRMKGVQGAPYEGTVTALCEELQSGRRDPWGRDLALLRGALEARGCRVVPRRDGQLPAATVSTAFYPTIGIRCMDEDVTVLRECVTRARTRSALWAKVDMDIALKCLKGLTQDVAELAARYAKLTATVDRKEEKVARLLSENEFMKGQVKQMLQDLEKSADPEYVKIIVRARKVEAEQEAQRRLNKRWDTFSAAKEHVLELNSERLELLSAKEELLATAIAAGVACVVVAKEPPALLDPTLHDDILDIPLPSWPGALPGGLRSVSESFTPEAAPVAKGHTIPPALRPDLLAMSADIDTSSPGALRTPPVNVLERDVLASPLSPALSAISAHGLHQTPVLASIDASFMAGRARGAPPALPQGQVTPMAQSLSLAQPAVRIDPGGAQCLGTFLAESDSFQALLGEAGRTVEPLDYDIADVTTTVFLRDGARIVMPMDESHTFWGGVLEAFQYRRGRYDLKVEMKGFKRQQLLYVDKQSVAYKIERMHKQMLRMKAPYIRIRDVDYSHTVQGRLREQHATRVDAVNAHNKFERHKYSYDEMVSMAQDPLLNAQDWLLYQDRPTSAKHEMEPTTAEHDENCYYRKYYKIVRGALPVAVKCDLRKEHVKNVRFDTSLTHRYRQPGILAALCGPDVVNPFLEGLVDLQASSVAAPPAALSSIGTVGALSEDRPIPFFATKNVPDQWVLIDLLSVVAIPHAYSFASVQPITAGGYPRSWRFEGSLDKVQWTVLKKHEDDNSFSKHVPFGTWELDSREVAKSQRLGYYFRYFRIVSEGMNRSGTHELQLSCFEIYGRVLSVQEYKPDVEVLRSITERHTCPRVATFDLRLPDQPFPGNDKKKKSKGGKGKGKGKKR